MGTELGRAGLILRIFLLVPQDAAEPEDGDAGRVWGWNMPGGGHLSHGDAQDSAAGCWPLR